MRSLAGNLALSLLQVANQWKRVEAGWLTTLGIGAIALSLLTQSFVVFSISLIVTIAFGAYSYLSFPNRSAKYEEELRQYERKCQKFLIERQQYDREVKLIPSEENNYQYRLQATA